MFGAQVSGPRAPACHDSHVFPGPRMGGGVGAKVGNDRGDALGMGEQTLNDLAFLGWPRSTSWGLQAVGNISHYPPTSHPEVPSILPHSSIASSLLTHPFHSSLPTRFGPQALAGLVSRHSPLSGFFKLDFSGLPGSAVAKTLFSQHRGPRFNPWSGN